MYGVYAEHQNHSQHLKIPIIYCSLYFVLLSISKAT